MDRFEVMLMRTTEHVQNMMKGKTPEFYNNFGMTIGGIFIWNLSLLLGVFVNVNKMHWLIYLLTNACIMVVGHHIGVETAIYFGKLNGWWSDVEGSKKVYKLQYEHLLKLVNEIKKDSVILENKLVEVSSDDDEDVLKLFKKDN